MSSPKSILLIGGSRGIGLGIVKQALSVFPEATIFATARDPSKANELQDVVNANKGRVQIFAADANDSNSLHLAAEEIGRLTDSLDIVIYNSGILNGFGNLLEVGIQPLIENITTNVYGAYYTATEFVPLLLKSKYEKKTLVLLSSSFASMQLSDETSAVHESLFGSGYDATAMYNISKTALNRLGKELDIVLGRQGLPVVLIHPGLVKTDMNPYGDIDISESVSGVVNVIQSFKAGKKNFYDWSGNELPW
ncbi:NAD(P)-binding protein [Trichoderma afarasin]